MHNRRVTGTTTGRRRRRLSDLPPETAKKVRALLTRSIQLMPSFAPSHYLLGLFNLGGDGDSAAAERHLRMATTLDAENKSYLLGLVQLQIQRRQYEPARQTLRSLEAASVDPHVRRQAAALLQTLERFN